MDPRALRQEMEVRGLTQTQFAKALCVTDGAVSMWLSGDRPIPAWLAVAIKGVPKKRKKSAA